jgi:UDP-N-acetylmuramoylalanine--D-glutamate ligase
MDFSGKRVALLGFGLEGSSTYRFLRASYPDLEITVFDEASPEAFSSDCRSNGLESDVRSDLRLGPIPLDQIAKHDVVVKSPGFGRSHPAVRAAADAGIPITSQLELFFDSVGTRPVIGITGTKGKSTTASLLYAMLVEAGVDVMLGGNIGKPPLDLVLGRTSNKTFVIEMSSYQLESVSVSPHIAVLLDITSEHLTYHGGFESYVSAKENITKFQSSGDYLIYCSDYPRPREIATQSKAKIIQTSREREVAEGCWISGDAILYSTGGKTTEICRFADIPLKGAFNRINVMAAAAAAMLVGAGPASIREAVNRFKALPHRIEFVGRFRGIDFYDDSISTVPEATLAALDALGPAVYTLILGGYDRNLDFSEFAQRLEMLSPEVVILFPTTGERIWSDIQTKWQSGRALPSVYKVRDMAEAVRIAFDSTPAGKTCLLSPASPSFGIFKDYRDRGEQFKKYVREFGRE